MKIVICQIAQIIIRLERSGYERCKNEMLLLV